jgi:hypothetical protein
MEAQIQKCVIVEQGKTRKMHTLWIDTIGGSPYAKPRFIKNLSIDTEKALDAGRKYAERIGATFIDATCDLREIKRVYKWTPSMVRFGKNYGTELVDCGEKFVMWVAKGCPLQNDHGFWNNHEFGGEEFKFIAQEIAVQMNLGVAENGRFYTHEQFQKLIEKRQLIASRKRGHHHQDGQRLTLNVTLIDIKCLQTDFGIMFINKFVDQDNCVYTYRGSKDLEMVLNQEMTITATIKHSSYNGENETYIQRIKK